MGLAAGNILMFVLVLILVVSFWRFACRAGMCILGNPPHSMGRLVIACPSSIGGLWEGLPIENTCP